MKFFTFIILTVILLPKPCIGEDSNPYITYRVKTYEIQEQYLSRIAQHQAEIMKDMEAKLKQQKWQTNAIAIMVFIMVGVGLFLSYLQFRNDEKAGGKSSVTMKIGTGNIEINSSVIGLVILALSFWFFQTYINHVYNVDVFNIPAIDMTTFGINK